MLLSWYWITGGHTIHTPIEGLLPPTGTEPTPFRNSASRVAGLQVHATTPDTSSWISCPCHYTRHKHLAAQIFFSANIFYGCRNRQNG